MTNRNIVPVFEAETRSEGKKVIGDIYLVNSKIGMSPISKKYTKVEGEFVMLDGREKDSQVEEVKIDTLKISLDNGTTFHTMDAVDDALQFKAKHKNDIACNDCVDKDW